MLNLFKRCVKRKLLSLILIGIIVEGIIGFVNIAHVSGQPSISITLKWRKNAGIGSTWLGVLAADLNNDGLMEIVITARYGLAVLNPISGNVIWSVPYGGDHVPFEIIDLNKDGIPEILLGPQYINGSSGGVLALHGNDGSVYWYNRQAACKGTYIAVADTNADGYPEIFTATPGKITALTHDGRIFASTWTYYPCWGGMTVGDTDFDGVFEVYLAERSDSYPSYPSGGRGLRAFWADNLTERWAHPDILCSSQAPELADVDKDGDLEIIVLQQSGGGFGVINTDGSVNTYNGIYRKQFRIPGTTRGHQNPTIADVDNDGNLEVIQCGDANHNAYQPEIFDLVDWKLDAKLKFPSIDAPAVADIDGDGKLELIATNAKNVTIFKYNPAHPANYDIIYTIPLAGAQSFSIAQDIDGDGKLELVFNQFNSWISVYDVDPTPAPTPLPRSGLYFYSQYRTRAAVYVPPPEQPPRISEITPKDGATSIPVSLSQLSFKLTDYQSELMSYTVTTNPNIGSGSGINVPNGKITIPVSGLAPSKTYTWTVNATDRTYTTTRTFTFYTEGNVVLTISTVHGSVTKNPDSVGNVYAYGTLVRLTAVADIGYTFSRWDGDLAWMGSNNPATILMNGDKTVTAVFIGPRLRTYVSPTGTGTITKIPDQSNYDYLATVELTAVPNAGWSFSYWSIANDTWGSPSIISTQNPTTITMDNNKRVTAVFVEIPLVQYELTINVTGMGTTNPAVGSYMYGEGTAVMVTAIPDDGWTFDHWVLDNVNVGSDNPYSVTMDNDHTLEAVFVEIPPPPQYELVISVTGMGTTIPAPSTYLYDAGTEIEVMAVPDSGWAFDHWVLDAVDVGSANPYSVTMNSNHALEAVFTEVIPPTQYQLTVSVSGSGTTDPAMGSYMYDEGTVVSATAYPASGWMLDYWLLDSMNVGNTNPYSVTMDADHTLEAVFVEIPLVQYELTINVTGMGTTNPAVGSYMYGEGTAVMVTAIPDDGWTFDHWVLDTANVGSDNPYSVTMDTDHALTATFIQEQYILTINVSPEGSGDITKTPEQSTYTYGTPVQLTASANEGWSFSYWSGDIAGSDNPISFIITGSMIITAHFELKQYTITASVSGTGGTIEPSGLVTVTHGEDITFTITPYFGYHTFDVLVDGESQGAISTYTFYAVDTSHTITTIFAPNVYTLTVNVSPEGSGTVALNNTGPYYYGDVIQLTAIAEAGWTFSHWDDGASGTSNPTTITIDGDKFVTAVFIETPNWWNIAWKYRRTITIDHTKVGEELTDFPVLIEITDSSLAGKAQSDGDDFVFTDANNTKLDHQIELYDNAAGHLIAWVKMPHLSSTTDTLLYMYYGNLNCENQQNSTGVWDENYKLVMHLNEETGAHYDSTINGNNGTPFGSLVQGATGYIGSCVEFNGGYIQLPRIFTTETQFTFSAWIYPRSGARYFISEYQSPYQGAFLQVYSDNRIELYVNNIIVRKSITINKWYYVVATFDGTTARLYVNEDLPISASASYPIWISQNMYIGDRHYHDRKFYGLIDEVRASNIAHSAAWILTEYNNQLNPATFYSLGPEEMFEEAYVLTTTVDGNGSVDIIPEKVAYTRGENVTLTASPDEGYEFAGWTGDLESFENPITLTITKNMNITAHFTLKQYTINASVMGIGGTIEPSGLVTVYHGENKTFTITPDTGYHILDVLVDDVSQELTTTYTFYAVDTNHTITVIFAPDEY